jgi:hypothetical protein
MSQAKANLGMGRSSARSTWRLAWLYAISGGVPQRSLYVALVVGAVLNLINQGDAVLGMGPINWLKLALTYCVPYAVCTYGAVSYRLKHGPAERDL